MDPLHGPPTPYLDPLPYPYPLPGPLDPLPLAQPDLLEDPRIHAEGGEGVAHVEDLVPHHRASEFEAAALRRRRPDWDFEPVGDVDCVRDAVEPVVQDGALEAIV